MTSFSIAASRARDPQLAVGRRWLMLRECVVAFPPYGFRSTLHHLLVSAKVPRRLEDDPDALVRAVDELDEARLVWLGHMARFADRRRTEKAAGLRAVRRADEWHHWGIHRLAYCRDPDRHPTGRLKAELERLIRIYSSGGVWLEVCPLCGCQRRLQPCPQCGVELRAHLALPASSAGALRPYRWRQIWNRTVVLESAAAQRFLGGRLAALRLGRRLATEVEPSAPGRRAFVEILPNPTDADRAAVRDGWTRRDSGRQFLVRHWEYDGTLLATNDYDIGAAEVRTAEAGSEERLIALLTGWGLRPDQFDYPWNIDDPVEAKDEHAQAECVTMSALGEPSLSEALTHLDDVFVNFSNGTFQWVHIKRFKLPAGHADDGSSLALLIAHDRYGDDYASGQRSDNPDRHGPYWRDRITVAAFHETGASAEDARLRAWAEEHTELDGDLRDELERQLFEPIAQASRIYRLADLGQDVFHDWGWILGPFHELVLIDRVAGVLSLIVASDD